MIDLYSQQKKELKSIFSYNVADMKCYLCDETLGSEEKKIIFLL